MWNLQVIGTEIHHLKKKKMLLVIFLLLLLFLCIQLQVLPAEGHEGSDPGLQLLDTQAHPLPLQALHPAVQPVLHHVP